MKTDNRECEEWQLSCHYKQSVYQSYKMEEMLPKLLSLNRCKPFLTVLVHDVQCRSGISYRFSSGVYTFYRFFQ